MLKDIVGCSLNWLKQSQNADWMDKAFIPARCPNFLSIVPRGRLLKVQCYNVVRVLDDVCGFQWA